MDRLLHPFFGARSSTDRTPRFYRRSRPRTIRPARRLPRRDLCRNKTDHHSGPLRRHLRASRGHAGSFPSARISNKTSNRSSKQWSAHRPKPASGPRLAGKSGPRHRLKRRNPITPGFKVSEHREMALWLWSPETLKIGDLASPHFPNSAPLPLLGYKMLCFPLDRHHIREYVKHPGALFADPLKGDYDHKRRGEIPG
jgi:hypothetical protein